MTAQFGVVPDEINLFEKATEGVTIRLPLPPRILSPNPSSNPKLYLAQSPHKAECRRLAAEAVRETSIRGSAYRLTLTGCIKRALANKCPHKRRAPKEGKKLRPCQRCPYAPRDVSNLLAAAKSYMDGIADGLGITDGRKRVKLGPPDIDVTRGLYLEVRIDVIG